MTFTRLPLTGVLLALLLAVAACSSPTSDAPSASASASLSDEASASAEESASSEPSDEGTLTSVFDLEVGDCFDTEDVSSVDEVTVVGCEATHVYEVFEVADYDAGPDEAFPGDDALNDAAEDVCRPGFEDYVGVPYDDSEWFGTFINPSEQTWEEGDREILCVLHTEEETGITGSAEGTNR